MALTLGPELYLAMHSTSPLSYTQIEKAATDAGLTEIGINRNPSGNGEYDLQLVVRGDGGQLPAAETINALAGALEALEALDEPPAEPEA